MLFRSGSLGCGYVYEVHPNGSSITSFDVSVEDGDIGRYTYHGPANWSMSMVTAARAHDFHATEHGTVTGSDGTCPYVLRFSGPAKTTNFQVGFDYEYQDDARFHAVHWKTSGNHQANWTFPVGEDKGPVHSPVRLNVLLIVLDDVGTDKLELFDASHQHAYAVVPTLEELAGDGVRFTNFYVNPVCSTSRACYQTGRYAHRHGIGMLVGQYSLPECEVTLGELLKLGFSTTEAAYATGAFGKWHVTETVGESPAENDFLRLHAVRNGYDRFYGTLGTSGHFNWTKVITDAPSDVDTESISNRWSADVVRQDASAWIDAASEPFFAYVAFSPPHSAFVAPPYETEDSRSLLSQDTRDALDAPGDDDELDYRAMLEAVDAEIGYLLADMDPGKRARTVVMVACDNGTPEQVVGAPHDPDHAKGTVYQLGVRVPMIVSGPLASTGTCDAAVGAVDLFATIAAITGADPDVQANDACSRPARDSVSILPLIEDPSGSATRPALSQRFIPNGTHDEPCTFDDLTTHERAVTDGHYKYIRRLIESGTCESPFTPPEYEHELYDLIADPDELTDLYPEVDEDEELELIFAELSSYMDLFEF